MIEDKLISVTEDALLSKEEINQLSSLFSLKQVRKGDYFLKEGAIDNRLGIVASGVMRAFTGDESGEETNILFFKENDIVRGNFAHNLPATINIQGITDCELLIADLSALTEFLKICPKLEKHINSYLYYAHSRFQIRLTSFIKLDAGKRYELFIKQYPGLLDRIPHYHIANFLGISTTQLSRIRAKITPN
jgi:CRP-like cAMP-binding protein